jgi:hypothetical protein
LPLMLLLANCSILLVMVCGNKTGRINISSNMAATTMPVIFNDFNKNLTKGLFILIVTERLIDSK